MAGPGSRRSRRKAARDATAPNAATAAAAVHAADGPKAALVLLRRCEKEVFD
jgi:hypothetical protein